LKVATSQVFKVFVGVQIGVDILNLLSTYGDGQLE